MRRTNILSFGAGVNSTAILILSAQGKYPLDAVIFADTQCERPETYQHIEQNCKPLCEQLGIPFHIVSRGNLYDWYVYYKMIPVRMIRACTEKFKVTPIKKFLKKEYGENFTVVMGIDAGESHRAERYKDKTDYAPMNFPLIDAGIDRDGCKKIIQDYGWEIPIKSGCFFCPFTRKIQWLDLLHNHRGLFLKAEMLEKQSRMYPQYTITNKSLEKIRESIDLQKSLCEWVDTSEHGCVFCHE